MLQITQPDHFFVQNPRHFGRKLLKWNSQHNTRQMPWKGIKDPYKIWLSEIILQQTRVDQGLAYFNRFIQTFPDIDALAAAPEKQVFKLWEGLGYYSRCRNLMITAKFISVELHGIFPDVYDRILSLKGVGPYSAAAISSFAFGLPHAVVDGNVCRVLARIFGIEGSFDCTANKNKFRQLAQCQLDKTSPGEYNQALMDFGATVCKPAVPLCGACPFNKQCFALNQGMIDVLPTPKKKLTVRKRYFTYLLVNKGQKIALVKREKKDIWQQLFEFCLVESNQPVQQNEIIKQFCMQNELDDTEFSILGYSPLFTQQLTHQHISCRFMEITTTNGLKHLKSIQWVNRKELKKFPFPRIINKYLETL